ncbi:MAG: DNA polymerase III subunit delta' [Nitrospirae bacterium]|nr:DNA polymerase III subunit delta' [Nitrospirota bacterium]
MAFKGIIGQERATRILLRTLERGKVPSAYLFSGESGIGKRYAALNLAKALNCRNNREALIAESGGTGEGGTSAGQAPGVDACDACPSCRKIDAGTHPDLVMLAPEKGEIRVSEIRAVEDALSLRPFEGRRKVVILDDAETMNQSAANAFLKTLEEPPDESLLILISSNPDSLPETIRSRCSRIHFVPLTPEECGKVIEKVLTDGGSRPAGDALATLVRLSMGRPGLAVSPEGEKERERFFALFHGMLYGGNETWADREEMERWFDMTFLILRDLAVLKITGGRGEESGGNEVSPGRAVAGGLLNRDKTGLLSEMAKTMDIKGIIRTYTTLTSLKGQMDFNLNKAITWNYTSSLVKALGEGNG